MKLSRRRMIEIIEDGAHQPSYYFDDVNGNDGNNGLTQASAFQTVTKCNTMATTNPTWKRLFKGGGTFRGLIYPQPNQYFGSYGTGKPKVYGSAGFNNATTWTPLSSTPAQTGDLDNETFEGSGSGGYVEAWTEVLGSGSVCDEANQDIARPTDGGSYILKTQKVSPNYNALTKRDMGANKAIVYARVCVNITAEGLADGQSVTLFNGQDNTSANVWTVQFKQQTGSAYTFDYYNYTNGAYAYRGQKTGVNLSQWYKLEVLHDITNSMYDFRVDGTSIFGSFQNLTGTNKAGTEWIRLGDAGNSYTLTAYFDREAVNSTAWLLDTISAPVNTWKTTYAASPNTVWMIDASTHWGNKAASIAAIAALYDWFADGSYLYVQSGGNTSGYNPNTLWTTVEASNQTHCFWWSPNNYTNVTINGFECAYCSGVGISGRSGWHIINNTIHHIGINSVTGDSVGCEFSGGSGGLISSNTIYEVKNYGVNINSWNPYDASNNVVEKNTIYDCHYGINLSPGTQPSNQSGNIIRYNKIYWDAGFSGTIATARGVEANCAANGVQDAQIYYNLIYGLPSYGISLDTYTINTNVYNNTIKAAGIGIAVVSTGVTGINLINNIVVDATTDSIYIVDKTKIATCDYNCWYAPSSTNYAHVGSSNYTSAQFATYKSDSGFDTHGLWQNPNMVSASDFHLASGSPCIGAGESVSLLVDVDGSTINTPPDMGSYKY